MHNEIDLIYNNARRINRFTLIARNNNTLVKYKTIYNWDFISCPVSYCMWMYIDNWIGLDVVLPLDLKAHYLQHLGLQHNRVPKKCWQLLWFATLWSLWLHRNDITFNGSCVEFAKIYYLIRIRAWSWCSKLVRGKMVLILRLVF